MRRRAFIWIVGGSAVACVVGCSSHDDGGGTTGGEGGDDPASGAGSGVEPPDAAADACIGGSVTMHDTYAQALYYDGTYGPLTGTITVAQVIAGTTVTMDFWHGHGGVLHRYTLDPTHFAALARGERVTLTTTEVDAHSHMLFIDPRDETYRVPGAPDVEVPLGC